MNLPVSDVSTRAHHDEVIVAHYAVIDDELVLCHGGVSAWIDMEISMPGLAAEFRSVPSVAPIVATTIGGRFVRSDESVAFYAYMENNKGQRLLALVFRAPKSAEPGKFDVDESVAKSPEPYGYFPPDVSQAIAVRERQLRSADAPHEAMIKRELADLYAKALPVYVDEPPEPVSLADIQ